MNMSSTHPQRTHDELVDVFAAMLDEQRRFRTEQIADHWARESAGGVQSVAEREVRDVLFRGAVAALHDINAAIERIARGSFGRCTRCEEPIPVERLEIVPQAARCLACERAR